MIKGDRDSSAPSADRNISRLGQYKYPLLNLTLALALAPAVLGCSGRPSRPSNTGTEAPARAASSAPRPPMSAEDEELVNFGKEILESRKDCVVLSLEREMTSLRRGVRTYEEAQIKPGDPNRATITATRFANSSILKEEADKLKDKPRDEQARELGAVYFALARANLITAREETGSAREEHVDFAKCGFVKYVSLQVILDEMGTERGTRRKVSWAPGIEV